MNLTALTLLQGRLLDMVVQSGAELQRLRDAENPTRCQEPEWFDMTRRSQTELVKFFERRLSTATRALERIDNGTFGSCQRCDQQIDQVQLFVRPAQSTCAACGEDSADEPTLELSLRPHEVVLRRA